MATTFSVDRVSEIKLFGENGKELITSFNSKRAITKTYDHKGKLEKED